MPNVSSDLFQLIVQAGFAGLFVWLLLRTQDRQDKREDRLMQQLDVYSSKMPEIIKALEILPEIAKSSTQLAKSYEDMAKRLDQIEKKG